MTNGYELATAQTLDNATPKIEDLTEHLPANARNNIARGIIPYQAENELLMGVEVSGSTEIYRSLNGGRKWELAFTLSELITRDYYETQQGTLLIPARGALYRYTGGGESPTKVTPSGYSKTLRQNITQTADGDLYLGDYSDSATDEAYIFKSTDDGQTWTTLTNLNNIDSGIGHIHGVASQGADRLFVITGDDTHNLLETNDDFSTYNEWLWNTRQELQDISYTGITVSNNHLLLGADHLPSRLTTIAIGNQYGDIVTDSNLNGGKTPVNMWHVMLPPYQGSDVENNTGKDNYYAQQAFFHRIENDGLMQYTQSVRNQMLAVSTNNGQTWKFIQTGLSNIQPVVATSDSVYVLGDGGRNSGEFTKLLRIPKTVVWEYPEPDTQIYSLIYQEEIGETSSGSNRTVIGRGMPYHKFTDFRFGVWVDNGTNFSLFEDQLFGVAPMRDGGNKGFSNSTASVLNETPSSGMNHYNLADRPNGGFTTEIWDQATSDTTTATVWVQCSR